MTSLFFKKKNELPQVGFRTHDTLLSRPSALPLSYRGSSDGRARNNTTQYKAKQSVSTTCIIYRISILSSNETTNDTRHHTEYIRTCHQGFVWGRHRCSVRERRDVQRRRVSVMHPRPSLLPQGRLPPCSLHLHNVYN